MLQKRLIALTLFAALAAMPPCVLRAQWVPTKGSGSGVCCFATNGSILFAGCNGWGAAGGVFLSMDSGTSWTEAGLQDTGLVQALAVIGTNLFAGTETGVYLSTNNGNSWTVVNNGLPNDQILALAVSGMNTSSPMLFAGTQGHGIFLSTNNGTSWMAVNTGLTDTSFVQALDIQALAVSGTNLFAGTQDGGVFLSTNDGTSWTAVNTGLPNLEVYALGVSGTLLFTGIFDQGIFRSADNGASWMPVNTGLTNPLVRSFAVNGTNLYAGTNDTVYLSTNNGSSWTVAGLPNIEVLALTVSGSYLFAGADHVWRLRLPDIDTSLYNLAVNGTINDTVSFGRVPVGNTALRTVSTDNAGKEPLTIQPIEEPGNDFATSDLSVSETLDSGESFPFEVFFEPTDTGYHSATLTLISQAKIVNVFLTGTGYDADDVKNSPTSKFEFYTHPNPFTQSTQISFSSEQAGYADISIVNLLGEHLACIFSGELDAGSHNFTFSNTAALQDGTYECLVRMNGRVETLPIVLLH